MDLIEVRLGTNEQHYAYIRPVSVWLAFPEGSGASKLYLTFNMETAFPPQQLREDTPGEDLLLGLFRWRMMDEIGAILITPAPIAEVLAACPHLVAFSARASKGTPPFPIGLRPDLINSITPAYEDDNTLIGSHIALNRTCMETNGPIVPVVETPDAVLRTLGWARPEITIGRVDRVLTGERNIIVPGKLQ